ncbi:MAG: hypothetical protein HKN42_08235 [Granulosicoccus sp.]|nr:hypothetical protein [Granulosicoccus sp.]
MPLRRFLLHLLVPLSLIYAMAVMAATDDTTPWQSVTSSDGSTAVARHESAAVAVDGKLYLLGGRGVRPVQVYDPVTGQWRVIGNAPMELHHFQPVAIGSTIYVIGAMTCCFPDEPSVAEIHTFDTVTEQWATVGTMPASRLRGSAAAAEYNGHIYVLGGNTLGHNGGAVDWLDRYDPVSRTWTSLPDAPHARDHFALVVVSGRLVAAGGRRSDLPDVFDKGVAATDIFDIATATWHVGADIPTLRAGALAVAAGNEVLVAGGEINTQSTALKVTEAYDLDTNTWRALQPMNEARHSGGSALMGRTWHVVSGSNVKGGGGETASHETLALGVDPDRDGDGLSDVQETSVYSTDPLDADSDDDGAIDGAEVANGSDPNRSDSDEDGLTDGDEINVHLTSPIVQDTDEDGLGDGAEVLVWRSDPRRTDSDGDGLEDADEVDRGTDINHADSDLDGLNDGAEIIAGTDPLDADSDDDGLNDSEDPEPLVPDSAVTSAGKNGGSATAWLLAALGVVTLSRLIRKTSIFRRKYVVLRSIDQKH